MGIELAALASYAAIAGAGVSIYSALNKPDSQSLSPPPPPAPPEMPPTMQSPQIDQAGAEARRKAAAAGGIMANIATGPGGVQGPASITGKTLLGT